MALPAFQETAYQPDAFQVSAAAAESGDAREWVLATATPIDAYVGAYKIGNTYQLLVTGEIVGARCWRDDALIAGAGGELSHVMELWNAAGTLVATSNASTETAGYTGWVEVAFPMPISTTTGDQWTITWTPSAFYQCDAAVIDLADPARATYVTGHYAFAAPGYPVNTAPVSYNVDLHWREAGSLNHILGPSTPTTEFTGGPYKVGNTYTFEIDATIYGARFWRADAALGGGELSHTVELWDPAHALSATTYASTEVSGYSGWIDINFPTPIAVTAGEDWTASVVLGGHAYAMTVDLADPTKVTFVTARYVLASTGGFPVNTNGANYFVDLRYEEVVTPPPISGGAYVQIHHQYHVH